MIVNRVSVLQILEKYLIEKESKAKHSYITFRMRGLTLFARRRYNVVNVKTLTQIAKLFLIRMHVAGLVDIYKTRYGYVYGVEKRNVAKIISRIREEIAYMQKVNTGAKT